MLNSVVRNLAWKIGLRITLLPCQLNSADMSTLIATPANATEYIGSFADLERMRS